MASPAPPAWRRAFDLVERRVSPALNAATRSPEVQVAVQFVELTRRSVAGGVRGAASWGLHLGGLPSHSDVLDLRRQLGEVQRELLAIRLDLPTDRNAGRGEP